MRRFAYALFVLLLLSSCKTVESAADRDPQKCERDPKCDKKRLKSTDCSTQCVDDPACMERCEQVRQPNAPLGH